MTQWEPPAGPATLGPSAFAAEQPQAHAPSHPQAKRRQYAAGQTQAYSGLGEGVAAAQYTEPAASMQRPGGQLFTPGFSADGVEQQQQQPHPQIQPPWVGAGGEHAHPHQGAPMAQLGQQFGQMNLQGGPRPVSSLQETSLADF